MTIPEPQFYLKDILSKVPTSIYFQARYSFNGPQRVMISTGDKILPSDWDPVKKRAIVSKRNPAHSDINILLDKYANTFKNEMRNCAIDAIAPTAATIRERMEKVLRPALQIADRRIPTLTEFMDKFIRDNIGLKAPNTVKSYVSTKNRFVEYGQKCGEQFDFNDINLSWRSGFIKFLQGLGVTRNTEGKHIKNMKVFLNEATERKLNTNIEFRSKSFSNMMYPVCRTDIVES